MLMQCTAAMQKSAHFTDVTLPLCGQKSTLGCFCKPDMPLTQIRGKWASRTGLTSRFSTRGLDGKSKKLPNPWGGGRRGSGDIRFSVEGAKKTGY